MAHKTKTAQEIIKDFARSTLVVTRLNDIRPTLFLLTPCIWGIMFAKQEIDKQAVAHSVLFAIACLLMYSAGSIISDFVDRNIDMQIPRTKNRPLAARTYSAVIALLIALAFSMVSLRIATLFNKTTTALSIATGCLILVYPITKRYFFSPQMVLGMAANAGVLIGYSSITGGVSIGVCAMYLGGIYWTSQYDTIYAYQDLEHDKRLGIHSLATLYGKETKNRIKSFATTAFICFAIAGFLEPNKMALGYYIILALTYLFLMKFLYQVNMGNPQECYKGLMVNTMVGLLIAFACIAGRTI